jgi:uncharacterized protein YaaR (DUF327 family)
MKTKLSSIKTKNLTSNVPTSKKISKKTEGVFFQNYLEDFQKENWKEKLKKLFEEIEIEKEKLARTCTISNLKIYKEKVREFLNIALRNVYSLKEEKIWDSKGKKKILQLIKCIDKSLEDLTKEFFKENINKVRILEKLEEIKGMLIDIYY